MCQLGVISQCLEAGLNVTALEWGLILASDRGLFSDRGLILASDRQRPGTLLTTSQCTRWTSSQITIQLCKLWDIHVGPSPSKMTAVHFLIQATVVLVIRCFFHRKLLCRNKSIKGGPESIPALRPLPLSWKHYIILNILLSHLLCHLSTFSISGHPWDYIRLSGNFRGISLP